MTVTQTIAYFAAVGVAAFILFVFFGALNYVKSEITASGVNFTAPQTLEEAVTTSGNFAGIGLILLAVVGVVGVVASLMYLFGNER